MAKQTFTALQVLTAAQVTALQTNDYNQTVSAKTASYILVAADVGTRITMNAAGATTITVNTALFAAGDTLFITNIGAGASTITAGTATVSTASSLVLAQYDSGRLYFTSTGVAIWEKYQGASASGLVLIKRASFSAVANTGTTFDDVFSAAYKNYFIAIEHFSAATTSDDVYFQLRVGAATTASTYYWNNFILLSNATTAIVGANTATQIQLSRNAGAAGSGELWVTKVGNSASDTPKLSGFYAEDTSQEAEYINGSQYTAALYTGFILSSSSTNVSGTIAIYGLATA